MARRPRPNWRAVTLLAISFHPAMSFSTFPSAAVRRNVLPRAAADPVSASSSSYSGAARRTRTRVAAEHQDILGVNGADVLETESKDDGETEPQSPSKEEPPEVVAVGGDNVSSGARGMRSSSSSSVAAAAAAVATDRNRPAGNVTRDSSRNKQPPLVARSLESVRGSLIRQEETIIFALIEREQFRCNTDIYTERTFRVNRSDAADIYGRDASFLEYMLSETEKLHATGD